MTTANNQKRIALDPITHPLNIKYEAVLGTRPVRLARGLREVVLSTLRTGGEARSNATRRTSGVAREKTTEVDDIEDIGQILPVDLRLGYAPGSDITMAVYTHLIGDDDHKVAAQLGEILRPDMPNFDLTKMQTHGT